MGVVKYKNFDLDMLDVLRLRDEIQFILKDNFGEIYTDNLTCKISNMYRFSGLLKEFKLDYLQGEIEGNLIDFSSNSVTLYGEIYQPILLLLKKIIAYYY